MYPLFMSTELCPFSSLAIKLRYTSYALRFFNSLLEVYFFSKLIIEVLPVLPCSINLNYM